MSLGDHVRTLGRGQSRSLTEAVGALLPLLMKGQTADEIAGLARAAQAEVSGMPQVDLDWARYAAGRTRGLPWFLLSARLLAGTGQRVLLHGWNGADRAIRDDVAEFGMPVAQDVERAEAALAAQSMVYMPSRRCTQGSLIF